MAKITKKALAKKTCCTSAKKTTAPVKKTAAPAKKTGKK